MAVNLFTGATNSNWATATNWSLGTVPTSTDTHVTTLDATSPNCTVNGSNRVCNALDFTGYTNTITMSFAIYSYGNITLSNTMNVLGSGALAIVASGTFTTNGFQWPNSFAVGGNTQSYTFADAVTLGSDFAACGGWLGGGFTPTITLNGDLIIKGNYTGSSIQTYNGAYTVYLEGNYNQLINCGIAGTTPWIWNGTTDKTFTAVNLPMLSNFTVNGTGVLTFLNNNPIGNGCTFKILSPCIANDCILSCILNTTSATFDTSLVTWKLVTFQCAAGALIHQLDSPIYTNKLLIGGGSQNVTINGSPIYIVSGELSSGPANGGPILGTSQIIAIGDKFTYLDSASPTINAQGVWRIPITINATYFLMLGRFVLSTGGSFINNSIKTENRATFRNLPELVVQANTTLTNINKCKFKTITISANQTLTMNEFFSGSPENKSIIRVTGGATNFKINFTDSKPKKAFFVNVKNCTVQTNSNQLNIIGRDSNSGLNNGILFGESGMNGFPLNKYGTEKSYSFTDGFSQGGLNN